MNLTSKQRAYLRGLASVENAIFQVGKGGLNDNLIAQLDDALRARELIKIKVLDNSLLEVRSTAEEMAERTGADLVEVRGSTAVLFRRNPQNVQIEFPKAKKK
ncbi:MAG: YhbY family RNA-binding protein [Oscillospiraceae bacterium]|nr:YhbY family RNA-binding protein [Oscillospiraceae bacterium]